MDFIFKKKSLTYYKYLLIACLFLPYNCKQKDQEKVIAEVYNYKLLESDIPNIYPENCNREDSTATLQRYVNNWINRMVVLHKAENNLNPEQRDFSAQLKEYEQSLVVHAYKELLLQQMSFDNISEEEIQSYYESHKDNFQLTNNIVKVWYVKVDKKSPQIPKFKQLIFSRKNNEKELLELCKKYAVNYFIDDVWLLFDDLLKEIPIQTYNHELFLKHNRNISVTDGLYAYIAVIKDFKIKESISPLSFEKEKIRSILSNQKKINYIEAMNLELRKNAEETGVIKVYNIQSQKNTK